MNNISRIKILPKHLADKIAAGEVVERPASVVKELLENSLDAKSKNIEVNIENAGRDLIRVVDDGQGINADDLKLAILRHATSKIDKVSDLSNINTLGFRGEALSSISAVSFLKIFSRTKAQQTARCISVEAGEIKNINESAGGVGTTVEVKNLFFNTPARLKFLKSKSTETAHIIRNIQEIALADHSVSLKLLSNNDEIINCDCHEELLQRIEILFGCELANILVPISFEISPLKITGFISKPGEGKKNRGGQYIFVNKRPVNDKMISHAISQGYHTHLMQGQFPRVFIFIETSPELVDVNVHPGKREVRFQEAALVHDVLVKTIKDALTNKGSLPSIERISNFPMPPYLKDNQNSYYARETLPEESRPGDKELFKRSLAQANIFSAETKQSEAKYFQSAKYLQIDNTYIALPDKDAMIIIDVHAAHERILFNKLKAQFESKKAEKQKLLLPITVNFSKDEFLMIKEIRELLDTLGFEVEDFGDQTVAFYAYPAFLGKFDIALEFKNIVAEIIDLDIEGDANIEKSIDPILATIACHCAVRAHQALRDETIDSLISDLWKTSSPYTCPHGRPTIIFITSNELQKRFKRK